ITGHGTDEGVDARAERVSDDEREQQRGADCPLEAGRRCGLGGGGVVGHRATRPGEERRCKPSCAIRARGVYAPAVTGRRARSPKAADTASASKPPMVCTWSPLACA